MSVIRENKSIIKKFIYLFLWVVIKDLILSKTKSWVTAPSFMGLFFVDKLNKRESIIQLLLLLLFEIEE